MLVVLDTESRDGQGYVGHDERWHKGTISPHGNQEGLAHGHGVALQSPTMSQWNKACQGAMCIPWDKAQWFPL